MTISRTQLANYLDAQFSGLATAIGQDSDTEEGYRPDIDAALRKLGKTESELATATVEDSQGEAVFALVEYYAARRFWRQLSDRANVKVDDSQFDYKQVLLNVKTLVDDAAAAVATLGYSVSAGSWGIVDFSADWIESAIEAGV